MALSQLTEAPPINVAEIVATRDRLAGEYREKVKGQKPEQVVGKLMGSVPSEFVDHRRTLKPNEEPVAYNADGRDMIALFGTTVYGVYGAEGMKLALTNALKIPSQVGDDKRGLYMLAYPHFSDPASIKPTVSEEFRKLGIRRATIMTVTEEQIDAFRKVLHVDEIQSAPEPEIQFIPQAPISSEPIIPDAVAPIIPAEQPQAAVPADVIATPVQIVTEPPVASVAPAATEGPAAPVEEPTKVETPAEAALRELMAQTAGGSATPTPPATPTTPIVS